jgi:hypothetical protein
MERKNLFVAALWMVVITIALFFLPLVNGLIGGAVGGYKAGDWKRALAAAVIPAAVVAVALWIVLIAFGAPVIGFVAGAAAGVVILLADVGIFVGAIAGGLAAQHQHRPLRI